MPNYASGIGTPAVQPSPGIPPSRSLANYRRIVASSLGSLTVVTTDSAGKSDGSSIISTALAGGLDANAFRQCWAYLYDGGSSGLTSQMRRVGDAALNPNSGELTFSVPFQAQIPTGATVELHRVLPPLDHDGFTGLRTCINNALGECWTYRLLPTTGVNGQPAYDLSTLYDWLDSDAIDEVYGPALDPTLNPQPWSGFAPILNADSLKVGVQPTFDTGAAATTGVFMPLDRYINVAGVWGPSTVGLQADTDQALMKPLPLRLVALAYVYDVLSHIPDGGAAAWEAKSQRQRLMATRWKLSALPRHSGRMGHGLGIGTGRDPKSFSDWGG